MKVSALISKRASAMSIGKGYKMERTEIEERLKLLREPFGPGEICKLPKPYKKDSPKGRCNECGGYHGLPAAHLDYVGHAALTDRLLKVDPLWNWEPLSVDDRGLPLMDENGGMWIKLTICGHTRLGYGDAEGKKGPNAIKEVIGDALRNAAMRFGAALDLWHKGELRREETEDDASSVEVVSDKQLSQLRDLIADTDSDEAAFCRHLKVQTLELLPAKSFDNAKALLDHKKKVMK